MQHEIKKIEPEDVSINTLSVFDSEENKWVEVSPETQRMAGYVHQQIIAGSIITAIALKKIRDERLYLALGATSFEEYINTMLPMGRSTAYNYLKVADKIQDVLPGNISGDSKEIAENASDKLQGLGFRKLQELTSFDDEDFKKLLKEGRLDLKGGSITIEDVKEMSAREVARRVKEIKEKYQDKVSDLAEKVNLLKEENRTLTNDLSEMEEEITTAKELEAKYGPKAGLQAEKIRLLDLARRQFNEMMETIIRVNITPEDSQSLQKDLVDFIKKLNTGVENVMAEYDGVISLW